MISPAPAPGSTPSQGRRLPAGDVAATLLRLASGIVALRAAIALCLLVVSRASIGSHGSGSPSDRNMLAPVIATEVLRLVVGLAVAARAPRIASWAGLHAAPPATPWSPRAAMRLATAFVGLWAVFLSCAPAGEMLRAWTGFGIPAPDDPYRSVFQPDVGLAAVTTALYVGFGSLLVVGPARGFRRRIGAAPPAS